MALSATGRTLRIRRPTYADSPGLDESLLEEELRDPTAASTVVKLKKSKKLAVKVQLDGPADNFASGSVVASSAFPEDAEGDALSSDDELFKDVRTYLRQTMGKTAVLRAEAGICGIGEYVGRKAQPNLLPPAQWLDGSSGNYITVRHPAADAVLDVPPLPISMDKKNCVNSLLSSALPLTCAHWFDPRFVADIERAELAAIGLSENQYVDLRNELIAAYNVDPAKFLSVRAAKESVGRGEVASLVRVWAFLDYWGIINFHADPTTAPRYAKKLVDYPMGHTKSSALGASDGDVLCASCRGVCKYVAYVVKPDAAPLVPRDQLLRARFCATCFFGDKFPAFFSKNSFEPLDVVLPGTVSAEWVEEETMRLIEAIERFGPDWNAVANLIGAGKTAPQCLLHFIQLPMGSVGGPRKSRETRNCVKPNPFRDSNSGTLALISLLATAVPSEIGAAVAGLAAGAIQEQDVAMKPE